MGNYFNRNNKNRCILDETYFKQIKSIDENINYGKNLNVYAVDLASINTV
jgi:hypothetical protein